MQPKDKRSDDENYAKENAMRLANINYAKNVEVIEQTRRICESLSEEEQTQKMQIVECFLEIHKDLKKKILENSVKNKSMSPSLK